MVLSFLRLLASAGRGCYGGLVFWDCGVFPTSLKLRRTEGFLVFSGPRLWGWHYGVKALLSTSCRKREKHYPKLYGSRLQGQRLVPLWRVMGEEKADS